MKILWVSNAPWMPSGYGSQTRQVGRRIAGAGHEIEFVANDGTRGNQQWEGHLVRGSSGNDKYSRDTAREDLDRSGADWLIFLYDAWVYTERMSDPFEGLPRIAGWVPVDHFPVPLALYPWLNNGHLSIAMSRYGYDRLAETSAAFRAQGGPGFEVRYAPHAVDDHFVPTESDFRQRNGIPGDAYLVGIVAANNGTMVYDRKGFGDMASALAPFMANHPDAHVYVHSIQKTFDGMSLPTLFAFKGVPPDRLHWADQYDLKKQAFSDTDMAEAYTAMDVLLATSRGEGFGLPGIEAQACGTPVILSNWTAQAELVGNVWTSSDIGYLDYPNGILVAVDPDYDPRQGADWAKPRITSIMRGLEEMYARRGSTTARDAALAKAEAYRADRVFEERWVPILTEMASGRIRSTGPGPNRAQRRAARRKK